MFRRKPVFVLALLGAALVVAGSAAPASAAGISGACLIAGKAKTAPAVPLVGGKGGFAFAGVATCVGVEKGGAPTVVLLPIASAAGKYESFICGTGKAADPGLALAGAPVVLSGMPKTAFGPLMAIADYYIEFAGAGEGLLYWTGGLNAGALTTAAPPKVLGLFNTPPKGAPPGMAVGGVIQLIPEYTAKAPPGPDCNDGLIVSGVVIVETEPGI